MNLNVDYIDKLAVIDKWFDDHARFHNILNDYSHSDLNIVNLEIEYIGCNQGNAYIVMDILLRGSYMYHFVASPIWEYILPFITNQSLKKKMLLKFF
jgi:hypothetical protein